jgi:outer membrane protein OmpA-like peptidoglycan-associated protein
MPSGSSVDAEPLRGFLQDLAAVIGKTKWKVRIEVHTDLRGSSKTNQEISEKRAKNIADELLKTKSVERNQVESLGLGETVPVVKEEGTDEEQQKNRRITVRRLE